ncbi:uncharacterized protein LOC143538970 [Bidens hawaiensis]|uniref:uncharacterized protein LOC143538970 n=1 Tax=Bidens hawaiensis TaxID=980011 RepID=UPI00404B95F2
MVSWKKIDAVVLQWIYGTLDKDLVQVLEDESTAREAWQRVQNLFLNYKGPRAAFLQHELTNLTLASMPNLEAYCQRVRELADQLTAVDCPINNTQRIIHLVRGLPREYDATASLLNQNLPPWEEAVERLQSESRRIAARDMLSSTPIVAATVTNPPDKNRGNQPPYHREQPNGRPNYRQSQSRRDFTKTGRSNTRSLGQLPSRYYPNQFPNGFAAQTSAMPPYWAHPQSYAPYWTPPPCPYPTQTWAQPLDPRHAPRSINNPATTSQSQHSSAQAHLAEVNPLEPTQLANAVHALSVGSGDGDDQWHLDTGSTSHVTYDPGFQGWHDPESSQQCE